MPIALSLLITALAVTRATRVVTTDKVGLPLRRWILVRNGDEGWFTFLIHCKYCTSVWISFMASPLWWWASGYSFTHVRSYFFIFAIALALAQFVVVTAKLDEVP